MLNLINQAVKAFGKVRGWNLSTTVALLVVAQVLILAAAVVLVIMLFKPNRKSGERVLAGISLGTDAVAKLFNVGDVFNYNGLVVTAQYKDEKEKVVVEDSDYTIETPDMGEAGTRKVKVTYKDHSAEYEITVNPADQDQSVAAVAEQPTDPNALVAGADGKVIIQEESLETVLRYDRSFTARIIQSDDETKQWYSDLKNELLSYKAVHDRMSWKCESFRCHKEIIAKLAHRGKTLCILLPLNLADYAENPLVEDASDVAAYAETPAMVRLKNKKRVKFAIELIGTIMEQKGIARNNKYEAVDYYMPYQGIVELMSQGLAKRDVRTSDEEAIFDKDKGEQAENQDDGGYELEQVAPGVYVTKKTD